MEAEVAEARIQLGEAERCRHCTGYDAARVLQDRWFPGSFVAAHLPRPARPGAARGLLAREEKQGARGFRQAELPLQRAQRALQAIMVLHVVPHHVGPRMDQGHHAVEMLVRLVAVRDDDGLVVR